MVRNGKDGLLVKPKNPKELAKAILWVHEHPKKAGKMTSSGRNQIIEQFELETIIENVYREHLVGL